MTIIADFIAENAAYLNDDARSIIEALSDEQFEALVAATEELSGGGCEPGIDCGLVRTHETLIEFDASRREHWSEKGSRQDLDLAYPATHYDRVQMFKGQTRHSFIVLDLGDYCIVLK